MKKVMKEILRQHQVPGLALLVIDGNEIIYAESCGVAHVAKNIPMTCDTACRVASISKPVTATALMQLYEEERVKLDIDVGDYLGFRLRNPAFPHVPITLRHLLTHTSSLREGCRYDDFLVQSTLTSSPGPITDILLPGGRFYHESIWSAQYPPGAPEGWEYCNLASGVVATVIERVSGQYFQPYCRTHIFDPLGMKSAYLVQDLPSKIPLAAIYHYDEESETLLSSYDEYSEQHPVNIPYQHFPLGYNGSLYAPQGGLRASVNDLSKFLLMHMNGGAYYGTRLLRPATVALMHQLHWRGYGDLGRYRQKGLQFHRTDHLILGQTLIGHAGDAYGLIGNMYCDQHYRFGIIFLLNGGKFAQAESGFYDIEEQIMNAVYRDVLTIG